MTVDRHVLMAAVRNPHPNIRVSSLEFPGEVTLRIDEAMPKCAGDWGDYVRAAVIALSSKHNLRAGFRAVVSGDLPGAGLSSSAAVLIAYLLALVRVNGIELDRRELGVLVQKAENEYVGVASGLLDQSIILNAERGNLTVVDCSDMTVEQVFYPGNSGDCRVLIAYSGVARALASSGFNARVDECGEAARLLLALSGGESRRRAVLSDVSQEVFERFVVDLPRGPRRRAAHYFGEQRRVLAGIDAWRQGDLRRFGSLVTSSGASSIHNYECGTPELVTLYELLRNTPGVYGTRFSGGGFGGSCVALIEPDAGETIIEEVKRQYQEEHPSAAVAASFHVCDPGGSARTTTIEG
jgi:galactokinase/galacturonokinase